MHHHPQNGIGSLLTIAAGAAVFGSWLYVCYPATASALADDSRRSWSFVLLIAFVVVAVIAASIASSVLHGLLMLLKSLLQLALIVVAVFGGAMLWRQRSLPAPQPPSLTAPAPSPTDVPLPPAPQAPARWWDKHTQEKP